MQNFLWKFDQKTALFKRIARIFSLEKPCYFENRVVREPCKAEDCLYYNYIFRFKRSLIIKYYIEELVS